MKLFVDMIRTEKGMSMQELSEESGVAKSYIQRLEAGEDANPSIQVICKLARALGVEASELFSCDK